MQHYFTLKEIAFWSENKQVELPTVQRGFVWKAAQIENLWDSLLRGYPVGAFVLSDVGNNKLHILDGQQRATAICLGFAKETFSDAKDFFNVFIDLEPPYDDDSRKYAIRVITRSHPWGYEWKDNTKTLSSDKIRKAMDLYEGVSDPLNTPLNNFFPYHADFPIPLHFFLNAALNETPLENVVLIKKIKDEYNHWGISYKLWKDEYKDEHENLNDYELDQMLNNKITAIYNAVLELLHPMDGLKIPALYMNLNKMLDADNSNNNNSSDDVENLFVRLNSGGTQLSGEELNYSILKAHLDRDIQDEIEASCKHLFKPSRFITIAFRLYQQIDKESNNTDSLNMRIKPKQFQRTVSPQRKDKKNKISFQEYILELIRNKIYDGKNILDYSQHILAYKNEEQIRNYGLPYLIYSKIGDVAPELMFLLLYRIKYKGDRFSVIDKTTENEHRIMLGILTMFMWFGKGENLKDHSKLLFNIWPAATSLDKTRFWSSETVERASLNDVLLPFPSFVNAEQEAGLDKIRSYNLTEKTNVINKFYNETDDKYWFFINKIILNKDFILYAQRHFIESYFNEQQYRLEDTSLPFDWDHISPMNFVRNKPRMPKILKSWYQTIGNIRAWPYALNRMDSDNSPAFKLNPLEKNIGNDGYMALESKWQVFVNQNKHLITDTKLIKNSLLEWSFCKTEWSELNDTNLRINWKPVTQQIIYRNLDLIEEWYSQFHIDSLRSKTSTLFSDLLPKRKWSLTPSNNLEINEIFQNEDYVNNISSEFKFGDIIMCFYVSYPDKINGYLLENSIEFGILDLESRYFSKKIKNNVENKLFTLDEKWISTNFTLISSNSNSMKSLVFEMASWIQNLPINLNDREILRLEFKNKISSKYNSIIN